MAIQLSRLEHNGTISQGTEGRWMRPGQPALPPQAIFSVQQEGSRKDKISTTAKKERERGGVLHNLDYVNKSWISKDIQTHIRPEQKEKARDM